MFLYENSYVLALKESESLTTASSVLEGELVHAIIACRSVVFDTDDISESLFGRR